MSAWSQLEQLLTCAICLDRYRNPKLLPCHHTYCQEPCLEGLVDYARRQIKCPECRAEHRIPYQGVQTFPTNVTLVRFLELHRGITGEEPEPIPSMMERCGICSEKSSVERCAHCDKKVCPECKEAHIDILRREITRIHSQVRRALGRLTDSITQTERNLEKLVQNKVSIKDEVEEIVRRFVKDMKEREAKLLHDLEEYTMTEHKNLSKLKEDLDMEASIIESNCDLIDKHVIEIHKPWTDGELVEYKDICLKTLEFLRNFDPDSTDYTRKVRFIPNTDLDALKKNLASFGELILPGPEAEHRRSVSPINQSASTLSVPSNLGLSNSLMRSQSDHRLVAQFARQERDKDRGSTRYLETSGSRSQLAGPEDRDGRGADRSSSVLSFRRGKDGETTAPTSKYASRYATERNAQGRGERETESDRLRLSDRDEGSDSSRIGRFRRPSTLVSDWPRPDDDDGGGSEGERETRGGRGKFRSRFLRDRELEDEEFAALLGGHRSVRFEEPNSQTGRREISKVFEALDAPKGPVSGVIKLADTTHLMNRLHELDVKMKRTEQEKKETEQLIGRTTTTTTTNTSPTPPASYRKPPYTTRQLSEDEIEKQKKANKAAEAASATTTSSVTTTTTSPATTTSASTGSTTTTTTTGSSRPSRGSSFETREPAYSYTPYQPRQSAVSQLRSYREQLGLTDTDDSNTVDPNRSSTTTRRLDSPTTTTTTSTTNTRSSQQSSFHPTGYRDEPVDDDDDSVLSRYARTQKAMNHQTSSTETEPPQSTTTSASATSVGNRQVVSEASSSTTTTTTRRPFFPVFPCEPTTTTSPPPPPNVPDCTKSPTLSTSPLPTHASSATTDDRNRSSQSSMLSNYHTATATTASTATTTTSTARTASSSPSTTTTNSSVKPNSRFFPVQTAVDESDDDEEEEEEEVEEEEEEEVEEEEEDDEDEEEVQSPRTTTTTTSRTTDANNNNEIKSENNTRPSYYSTRSTDMSPSSRISSSLRRESIRSNPPPESNSDVSSAKVGDSSYNRDYESRLSSLTTAATTTTSSPVVTSSLPSTPLTTTTRSSRFFSRSTSKEDKDDENEKDYDSSYKNNRNTLSNYSSSYGNARTSTDITPSSYTPSSLSTRRGSGTLSTSASSRNLLTRTSSTDRDLDTTPSRSYLSDATNRADREYDSILTSLRTRAGSPGLTRRATVDVVDRDRTEKPYSVRELASLRSRSPSLERELPKSVSSRIDNTPSSISTRKPYEPGSSRYARYRGLGSTTYGTSSSSTTEGRDRDGDTHRLARSRTVGDILTSRYSDSTSEPSTTASFRDYSRRTSPVASYSTPSTSSSYGTSTSTTSTSSVSPSSTSQSGTSSYRRPPASSSYSSQAGNPRCESEVSIT